MDKMAIKLNISSHFLILKLSDDLKHATLCLDKLNLQRRNLEPCDEFVIFGGDPFGIGLKWLYLITYPQLSAFNDIESTNPHVS